MTEREQSAFAAGIKHSADMALASALMLEIRNDARQVRQRAAIEALRGLADGLRASVPGETAGTDLVEPTLSGEATNPIKSGLSAPAGTEPRKEVLSAEPGTTPLKEVWSSGPKDTRETRTPATASAETGIPASLSDQRHAAVAAGYSGDACTNCQNFTMRRSGTCLSCDTCGSTTGCS